MNDLETIINIFLEGKINFEVETRDEEALFLYVKLPEGTVGFSFNVSNKNFYEIDFTLAEEESYDES